MYNLLVDFLDPTATESQICWIDKLTPEHVSAARAYIFAHADEVLDRHLQIEARIAAAVSAQAARQGPKARETFLRFRDWSDKQQRERAAASAESDDSELPKDFPNFREWVAQQMTAERQGA